MAVTSLTEVTNQIQKFWSPIFTKQLRESLLLGSVVNKDYDGEIKQQGDTVTVSQINAPDGDLLTIGTDADSFNTEALSTSYIEIKADKRAVAAYEFQDLVKIQSLVSEDNPAVMEALNFAMQKQVNGWLYSLVAASTASPDHVRSGITNFNAAEAVANRKLAGQAKWDKLKPWYILADPSYYADMLSDATLTSSDFGASDAPVIAGQIAMKRYGFNILEDNSAGILTIGTSGEDCALVFHPDFLHLVMQTEAQIKISDLHSQKKFGYILSVDLIFGAKLGINGNVKHIEVYNT